MKIRLFDSKLEKFIHSLEEPVLAKALRTIDLLEAFGNNLAFPHSKKVHEQLFELRVRGKQEIRIFYAYVKGEIILLHGFIKKTERIPKKELHTALRKLYSIDTK